MATAIDTTPTFPPEPVKDEVFSEAPSTSTARKIYDFTTNFFFKLLKECFNTAARLLATHLVTTHLGDSWKHKIGYETPLKLLIVTVGTTLATWGWERIFT